MKKHYSAIRSFADLKERCWVDSDTQCWHWRGALQKNGCPAIWLPETKDVVSISMLTSLLKTGQKTTRNNVWFPTCATKHCANPAHREFMSRSEMMKRVTPTKSPIHVQRITAGKRASSLVMNREKALQIRASDEMGIDLAKRLNVSPTTVSRVRLMQTWRDEGSSVFSWRPT